MLCPSPDRISGARPEQPSDSSDQALLPKLLRLTGQLALGIVLVLPNVFYLRSMEAITCMKMQTITCCWEKKKKCSGWSSVNQKPLKSTSMVKQKLLEDWWHSQACFASWSSERLPCKKEAPRSRRCSLKLDSSMLLIFSFPFCGQMKQKRSCLATVSSNVWRREGEAFNPKNTTHTCQAWCW